MTRRRAPERHTQPQPRKRTPALTAPPPQRDPVPDPWFDDDRHPNEWDEWDLGDHGL